MKKIWAWIISLFRRSDKKRTRRKIARTWSLADLLDQLDQEHRRYRLGTGPHDCPRDLWNALRRMGAHVLPEETEYILSPDYGDIYKIPGAWSKEKLPTMMYVGWRRGRKLTPDGRLPVTGVWAFQMPKDRDWFTEPVRGVRYYVGEIVEENKREMTFCGYVDLDFKSGTIYVPKIIRDERVDLPQGGCYYRRKFTVPWVFGMDADELREKYTLQDSSARVLVMLFSACYHAWLIRDEYYQVATSKRKSRVTFCIAPGEQKHFFRDRQKVVTAKDGKRKRIIHYVREFKRKNGQVVKEHLRGIRQFLWRGYKVTVSIPKHHVLPYMLNVPPVYEDREPEASTLSGERLASKLTDLEEETRYRHGHFG